jgi:hypothetical protein
VRKFTLTNCVFKNNPSRRGVIEHHGDILILNGCRFSGNSGGGIDCSSVDLNVYDCSFNQNDGGIICISSNVNLNNCNFGGNAARFSGGAIESTFSDLILYNCIFSGNTASHGGAISSARSNMWLNNCTFCGNEGEYGSAINKSSSGYLYLNDCIVWDKEDAIYSFITDSTISISYSNICGGWPGEGNIDVDPLFVDPGYWADANDLSVVVGPDNPNAVWVEGDYHLQSQAGHWDSQSQSWIQDEATSPCIDAGNPMAPIGLEPFPNGAVYNMGAYGRTIEASKTYFGSPVCDVIIPGDINGDCVVDFKDLEIVVLNWMLKGDDFTNEPPTVTLIEPQDGDQIVWPGPTTVRAEATDVDGQVMKVEFYLQYRSANTSISIGHTDSNGTDGWNWEYEWDEHAIYGNWTVQAVATDNDGAVTISEIVITLIAPE